jgi:predicted PurR-regulated permease PerM
MFEFWKQPKFWLAALLVLWLAYVIGSNLEQVVTLHIVPWLLQPYLKVSTIVIVSAIFGALLTLGIQFMWRKGRSSKNASQSTAAAGTSSSTVA